MTGNEFAAIRRQFGLSKLALSRRLGISRHTISKIEAAKGDAIETRHALMMEGYRQQQEDA